MFGGRHSKFKNIFGEPRKKEECMDQIKLKVKGSDPPLAAVNGKFLAVLINCSTVDLMIRPLEEVGRVEAEPKGIKSVNSLPTCIEWCPRDDTLLVVGQHNGEINLMRIPENGIEFVISTNEAEMMWNCENGSVLGALWHPTAANALLTSCGSKFASAGSTQDTHLILWNTIDAAKLLDIPLYNCYLTGMSFNFNGSRLLCTDNSHITRIIDLRSTDPVLQEVMLHKKARRQNTVYLKDGFIFSTGYSTNAKREYALWSEEDLTTPIELIDFDTNSGVLYPIYDADINVLYVWGKGDSTVNFFEFVPAESKDEQASIKYLSCYQSSSPQLGIVAMPKLGVNISINEVTRLFKFHNKGFCEFIPIKCPRREQGFSEDVYPPTPGREPAISIDDWLSGADVDPILISLDPEAAGGISTNCQTNSAPIQRPKNPQQKLNEIKEMLKDIKNDEQDIIVYKTVIEKIEKLIGLHQNDPKPTLTTEVVQKPNVAGMINSLQQVDKERQDAEKRGLLHAVDGFVKVNSGGEISDKEDDPNKDVEWD